MCCYSDVKSNLGTFEMESNGMHGMKCVSATSKNIIIFDSCQNKHDIISLMFYTHPDKPVGQGWG